MSEKILILDTETTSVDKPFNYDFGWVVFDTAKNKVLEEKSYVIDQVWNNKALFSTAYFAEKRPLYTKAMKGRKAKRRKFGHVMQSLQRTLDRYGITDVYAYNVDFDKRVIAFNCQFFGVKNPVLNANYFDIWYYFQQAFGLSPHYLRWAIEHGALTDNGNVSTNAENAYRYIFGKPNFIEDHTALSDARIETKILWACINKQNRVPLTYGIRGNIQKVVSTGIVKDLIIEQKGQEPIKIPFTNLTFYRKKNTIKLK